MNNIILIDSLKDINLWDDYLASHQDSSIYHQLFFKNVIQSTYRHKPYYLIALNKDNKAAGVLPLFFVNSLIFGKELVSLPFCDYGGILADSDQIARDLLDKAFELSDELKCRNIILRQTFEHVFLNQDLKNTRNIFTNLKKSKIRMRLALPQTTDMLFSSFPAKLRSQIRKPQKEGCVSKNGGLELLDDFYEVFVHNMRDLGSPVHTKALMKSMLTHDPQHIRIFVIYHNNIPAACSMVCGYKDSLVNPWASFKRTYQKIAPNMLLYWEMLSFAINNNYKFFDFGRSTPGEGTFKFKEQWGAKPEQLYWYTCSRNKLLDKEEVSDGSKGSFIKMWQRVPLPVTKIIGPLIRRNIHL